MDRHRDRQIIQLFDAALDHTPAGREALVARARAQGESLGRDVEALLAADADATRPLASLAGAAGRGQGADTASLERMAAGSAAGAAAAMDASDDATVLSSMPMMTQHAPAMTAAAAPGAKHADHAGRSDHAAGADSEPGPALPATGMRIDRYEIIRELGRGGMGAVYLARDTQLGRRVAIKFLQSDDPQLTERFIVEARATARCSHENIVVIHDVKELGGNPFMVLEYLKGRPLNELVGDERIPPGRAVQLMVPVVRALACAHAQKIVHRDLKPANIFMTDTGTIKVLDFGIAKFVRDPRPEPAALELTVAGGQAGADLTRHGAVVGTLPYMSPEQWGADTVDHRTDIWAVGILLYRMIVGRHPLAPLSGERLMITALLDQPMPSAHSAGVDMPLPLADIIDHCLKKRKDERMPSADALLDALEPLQPGRHAIEIRADESPYTGLTAFQETDSARFFGRSREIGTVVARLHGAPLIGIIGPSGVGKSSFVRAGVIPALKQSGEPWEAMVIRPGRHPMAALANLVAPMITSEAADLSGQLAEHQDALQRLYQEPGYLGTVMRGRARALGCKLLLYVDQFEELFTLIRDPDERLAFTACLSGMADDPMSPLRLVLSIRSDFLDRVAEDQHFMSELSQSLLFLPPPDREGLRDAIVRPAEMMRYRFETPAMVEHMLDTLQSTPGCLPLLQFAATKLWEARDRERRVMTEESYRRLGGVVGALATHADAVLSAMPPGTQALARTILLQLVTPERTRAIASVSELCELTDRPQDVERIIYQLVDARLLVVQRSSRAGGTVEIVHEALIHAWPTLAHWLEESHDDAVFLEQLRAAARQWDTRGRSADLLWRGETMHEAQAWRRRYSGTLPALQEEYLRAVFAFAERATRIRRAAVIGTMAFLVMLVAAAAVALLWIRDAEREASQQAAVARAAEKLANERAVEVERQLEVIQREEAARRAAEEEAARLGQDVTESREALAIKNRELATALSESQAAQSRAEKLASEADAARAQAQHALRDAEKAKTQAQSALAEANRARTRTEELLEKERARAARRERELEKAVQGSSHGRSTHGL